MLRHAERIEAQITTLHTHLDYLRGDLERFVFLLGGTDGEYLFGPQWPSPPRPQRPGENRTRPRRPAMMTGVSASTVKPGTRFAARILILAAIAAGGTAIWYRHSYNVWPGQRASARVHWCGRDYENFGGPPQTWRQISSQQRAPIRPVNQYPPLGWSRQELLAATVPQARRASIGPPPPCAMIVYLRTGPNAYQPYSLEGGP